MPIQTVTSINRQTPIVGPAGFYTRVVAERLQKIKKEVASDWCYLSYAFASSTYKTLIEEHK